MLKYLTPLDWTLWVLITIIQIRLWKVSNGIFKFFRFALIYLLCQSMIHLATMICSNHYRIVYYITTLIEGLILAGISVEFSSTLIPKCKSIVTGIGPFVIAIPTFVIYNIVTPKEVVHESFIVKATKISELAFILSLALILICIAFEEDDAKTKDVVKSYALFLTMLVICTEVQMKLGITQLVRIIWPCSWLIGLGLLYVTINRCRCSGEWTIKSLA